MMREDRGREIRTDEEEGGGGSGVEGVEGVGED